MMLTKRNRTNTLTRRGGMTGCGRAHLEARTLATRLNSSVLPSKNAQQRPQKNRNSADNACAAHSVVKQKDTIPHTMRMNVTCNHTMASTKARAEATNAPDIAQITRAMHTAS